MEFEDPPRGGRGNPGVPRPGVKQSPTTRQPNRGRKPGDPFVCVGCRETFPADQEYVLGLKPQGRCGPCAKAKRNADHLARMTKLRGEGWEKPISKDERFPVINGLRECSECGDVLGITEFYSDRSVKSGLQNVCKPCRRGQRNARWHGLSPEEKQLLLDHQWAARLWHRYRLSSSGYAEMLLAQDGVCGICLNPPDKSRLAVDHDHACCPGEYTCGDCLRALLCHVCNQTVGGIERVGSVDPFAAYLAAHRVEVRHDV